MKRVVFAIVVILLAGSAMAQERADHPLIGRYPDAVITHQEVSNFSRYEILTGAESTEIVEGEVWMTLYEAPADSSTFSVYSTYLDFLASEGFTILYTCEPGTCAGGFLSDAYGLAPFADNGNLNYSAPITNANYAVSYFVSAVRETPQSTVYTSIAIAAGWYDYPQYKLDVVEVAANTATITSTGTRESRSGTGDPAASSDWAAPSESALFGDAGFLRVFAGYAAYSFVDPAFGGGVVIDTVGPTSLVTSRGYRNPHGPYAQVGYYPNPNFGLTIDGAFLTTNSSDTYGQIELQTVAELVVAKAGPTVRIDGDHWPASLSVGAGVGIVVVSLFESWTDGVDTREYDIDDFFALGYGSADFTIPIRSLVKFSAGFEYLFAPTTDLSVAVPDGADYDREYLRPNLGGLVFRFGVVAEM